MDITPGLENGRVRTVSALTLSVRARFNATAPNYESGGQEFESLRARQLSAISVRIARHSHGVGPWKPRTCGADFESIGDCVAKLKNGLTAKSRRVSVERETQEPDERSK